MSSSNLVASSARKACWFAAESVRLRISSASASERPAATRGPAPAVREPPPVAPPVAGRAAAAAPAAAPPVEAITDAYEVTAGFAGSAVRGTNGAAAAESFGFDADGAAAGEAAAVAAAGAAEAAGAGAGAAAPPSPFATLERQEESLPAIGGRHRKCARRG